MTVGRAIEQRGDDAWWTGPIIAAGAGTLPQGHALVEPYFFDVIRYGRYDRDGNERSARWFAAGRNTSATITPVIAINRVY